MTLFGQKMWVALIMVGGLQLMSTPNTAADVVDISAVVNLKSILGFGTDPQIYCITGDNNTTITTHNVLDGNDAIRFTGPAVNKTAEYHAGGYWPLGVVCKQLGNNNNNYDVAVPLRYQNDSRTPTKLSYTLDPDQDLVINVRDAVNLTDKFKKAGDGGDYEPINISNGRLTIPHQQLKGSGIYDLRYVSTRFSLVVRECTSGRYGPDCTRHCPDCKNGGMCHSQTGHCACPPGVMGPFCQTPCPLNRIGKDCTVRVPYTAGVAVCVPYPVGCTCLPGYRGTWCEQECNGGHWGAACNPCSEDDCDKATGFCNHENGEFVYQVIVAVLVLVGVVCVCLWCKCWWTKRKQHVAPRPTENRKEPGPSASVLYVNRKTLKAGPDPVTIRNPDLTEEHHYYDMPVASILEHQANEEEHIYEEVKEFLVDVQVETDTAHYQNLPLTGNSSV